ncbi:MAG: ribonuclease [Pseudomonadota bacterium]
MPLKNLCFSEDIRVFESKTDRSRIAAAQAGVRDTRREISPTDRVEAVRRELPIWARRAQVGESDGRLTVILDDECSAAPSKIAELQRSIQGAVPGEITVERSLRYQHIYALIADFIGRNPELRIKIDSHAPLVYVIVPSGHYPRSEDFRASIEATCGLRTCLVLSDPSHKPIVLLPPPSERAIQTSIEKTHLRMVRRQIAALVPEGWRASVDVTPAGVSIVYAGMLRSCQEEERIRIKAQDVTSLPISITPHTRRDNLQDALLSTVPEGIEVWRTSFYNFNLRSHEYRCAVVQIHIPAGRDSEALAWRLGLEERFGVHLVLQPERVSFSLSRQLSYLADDRGVISSAGSVRDLITNLNGRAPAADPAAPGVSRLGPVMDLRGLGFLTFDSVGTKEPEDALFAEALPDGGTKLFVSFADVSREVPPSSKLARHARRAGFSLYAGNTAVPMLGEELTYDRLSLTPGTERLAWTVEMEISSQGKIRRYDFYRALIKVAAGYTHADLGSEEGRAGIHDRPMFEELQQVAKLLEHRGLRFRGLLKAEPETPSDRIVGACMVAARERIAHFFASRGIAVPFRVHGPPGSRQRDHFVKTARALGIKARSDDFGDPERFSDLLDSVEQHPGGRHLFHEILDAHLQRARFSRYRAPHIGAKCEQYTEIKGLRSYAGLLTQWQADRFFSSGQPLLSHTAMEREVRHLNRKARSAGQNTQRLAMLQRIEERLNAERGPLEAVVEEDRRGEPLLYVPALSTLGMPLGFTREELPIGARLTVILAGYHVRSMRYAFMPARTDTLSLGSELRLMRTPDLALPKELRSSDL